MDYLKIWENRKFDILKTENYRNSYSRDRARIIHSAFFRRLQAKTQVLGLGDGDFYRTRLTHSLEVAQIGSGIADFLKAAPAFSEYTPWIPEQNLIESIGLAHDIGHPPFGHGGEVALNYSMYKYGGFEGNAQTLRICCKLGEHSDINGLNLTRRTLLGLIKYPATYSKTCNISNYDFSKAPLNLDSFKPPKCIFDCEENELNWITEPLKNDVVIFCDVQKGNKHFSTKNKSFDTSIMEIADDIAYGVHDLEDAIALGLVNESEWNVQVLSIISDPLNSYPLSKEIIKITSELFSRENRKRKRAISFLVNYFIKNCEIIKLNRFNNNLIDLQANLKKEVKDELRILQEFIVTNVIKTPEVQTLEYKGQQMIIRLFEAIANNPSRLLPKKYFDSYAIENNNPRIVCDFIAGTTDAYATKLYHKIFTPSNGSIFDKL